MPDDSNHELAELRAAVDALRAQIRDQATRDLAAMTQAAIARERDFAQRELELNAKLLHAMTQVHAGKFDAGQLHERLVAAEGMNRALTAQAVEISGRLQQQAARIGELVGTENGLRAQVAGQGQTIEQYAAQAVALVGQVGALEQRIQEMVLQARSWEEHNHALSVRVEVAAGIQKSLESHLALMNHTNQSMADQIRAMSEENRLLKVDRESQAAAIEEQRTSVFAEREKLKRLEEAHGALMTARNALQDERDSVTAERDVLTADRNALKMELALREQQRLALDGALQAANARVKELSAARSRRILLKLGLVHRCSWESA